MTTGTKARIAALLAWAPSAALLAGGVALVTPATSLGEEATR